MLRLFFGLLSVVIFCHTKSSYSQSYLANGGARSFSIAHANTCISDPHSPTNNVAGIANQDGISIAGSVQNYYNDVAINNLYFNLIYPLEKFGISLGVIKHGNAYLNQQKISMGIANQVGFVKLGIQVGYLQYKAEGFGSAGSVIFEFGGIAELTEKVKFGAHIFNFSQSSLKKGEDEQLPVLMKAGINYTIVKSLNSFFDIEKTILSEPLFKVGLEYEILVGFYCRTGISINPTKNFFGLGYRGKKIGFDYGFSSHPYLGMTHQLALEINLKRDD